MHSSTVINKLEGSKNSGYGNFVENWNTSPDSIQNNSVEKITKSYSIYSIRIILFIKQKYN